MYHYDSDQVAMHRGGRLIILRVSVSKGGEDGTLHLLNITVSDERGKTSLPCGSEHQALPPCSEGGAGASWQQHTLPAFIMGEAQRRPKAFLSRTGPEYVVPSPYYKYMTLSLRSSSHQRTSVPETFTTTACPFGSEKLAIEALMELVLNSGKVGSVLFWGSPVGKVTAAIGAECIEERPPVNKKERNRVNYIVGFTCQLSCGALVASLDLIP